MSNGGIGAFTAPASSPRLPDARYSHVSVAYRGFLYVLGGDTVTLNGCDDDAANTTACNDVVYAAINSDGSLAAPTCTGGTLTGSWCTDSDNFAVPRAGHSAVVYNNFL